MGQIIDGPEIRHLRILFKKAKGGHGGSGSGTWKDVNGVMERCVWHCGENELEEGLEDVGDLSEVGDSHPCARYRGTGLDRVLKKCMIHRADSLVPSLSPPSLHVTLCKP